MRNVMVLGSGRSGTSMVAGTLSEAGWFVGADPYPARDSNPKGFFESADVNGVNEYLLAEVAPASEGIGDWQHWLCRLPATVECRTSPRAERRIQRLTAQSPWCFKDPRLCYTLPLWRPYIGDAGLLCVFRDPAETAASIVKECASQDYLRGLPMDFERALDVWQHMYRRVLDRLRREGEWLFLHYEQALSEHGLARLESFVGGPVSKKFPDGNLRRSRAPADAPLEVRETYRELCELSQLAAPLVAAVPRSIRRNAEVESGAPSRVESPAIERARHDARAAAEKSALEPAALPATLAECENFVDQRMPAIPRWMRSSQSPAELLEVVAREEWIEVLGERCAATPWPIATNLPRRVLAWPEWRQPELQQVIRIFEALFGDTSKAALCLRFDPRFDGELELAMEELERAHSSVLRPGQALEVVLVAEPITPRDLPRLGLAVEGWVELDSSSREPKRTWLTSLRSRSVAPAARAI